jgi:hypothetical protein
MSFGRTTKVDVGLVLEKRLNDRKLKSGAKGWYQELRML